MRWKRAQPEGNRTGAERVKRPPKQGKSTENRVIAARFFVHVEAAHRTGIGALPVVSLELHHGDNGSTDLTPPVVARIIWRGGCNGERGYVDIFRALYWREFELTVEDCRAYRMRNQCHFTFYCNPPVSARYWGKVDRELRAWIWSTTMARILEVFGMGDDDDLMKVRCRMEDVMDGKVKAPAPQEWKGGATKREKEQVV